MKNKITKLLENALNISIQKGQLPEVILPYMEVEAPAIRSMEITPPMSP